MARDSLDWIKPFSDSSSKTGGFEKGNVTWFADGELNACYNCLDRWAAKDRNKVNLAALYHECAS